MSIDRKGLSVMAGELLRMAKEMCGFEFPSKELMEDYLRQHPKADPSKHWVKDKKPGKVKEERPEEKGAKKEDQGAKPGSFRLPKHKSLKYEAEGDLGNVSKWKAKIVLGNSMDEKKHKVGDMDEVGYVAISTVNDDIIPIARSDEHKNGYELLYHLSDEGIIDGRPEDFITLFSGNNYPHYTTSDTAKYASAVKKWLSMGGGNYPVASRSGRSNKDYVTDMEEYAELGGNLPYGSEKPSKAGREILEHLEKTMDGIERGDAKEAFDGASRAIERIEKFSYYAVDDSGKLEGARKRIDDLKGERDVDGLARVFRGIVEQVQAKISDKDSWSKPDAIFGSGDESKGRIDKLAKKSETASAHNDPMTQQGRSVVETLEGAASMATKKYGSNMDRMRSGADKLIRGLTPMMDDIEGLGQALERLERALAGEDDDKVIEALFSFNGVKNLLHQRLRKLEKDGVEKDKHFGNVKVALEEFKRLGQI